MPIAWLFCKLTLHSRFENRRVLKAAKGTGCFVYGNHTQQFADAFMPNLLLCPRQLGYNEYAGAPDHYGKFLIHPRYINAGVLLFNMKRCRETGLFEKARQLIRTKKLVFADQSALARSATRRMVLSQRFNDQKFLYKKTVIRHFSKRLFYTPYPHTENIKQWDVEKVHAKFRYTCFDDIYEEYLTLKENYPWKP